MHDAKPTQPRRMADVSRWDRQADVVIVGYGGAGACAAIEAADAGADVLVLELTAEGGGSTAMSEAEMYLGGSGGTPLQRSAGFEDSSENMLNFLLRCQGEQADAAKVRSYVDGAVEHFEWLVSLGAPYRNSFFAQRTMIPQTDDGLMYTGNEQAYPFTEVAEPCPRGHMLQVEGHDGGRLIFGIWREQIAARPRITVECGTRVVTLVIDEDNHVHGVVAQLGEREQYVRARRGVILCAGGFSLNKAMVAKYAPLLTRANTPIAGPGDTGSGILMGMGVGAAAINMHEGFVSLPYYPPASLTRGILVNAQGQRFINEDCYHGRVGYYCLLQRDRPIYLIANAADFEEFNPKTSYLQTEFAARDVESIEQLEKDIGLTAGSLQATLSVYNRYAAEGSDPLFGKAAAWLTPLKPPLTALNCTPDRACYPFFTLGGLDTLPTGEVLTPEGQVIPGLYAAGRTACGIPRRGDGYASGSSVGDATFFGRLAGRTAAGHVG